ncbi:MAG: hypothetical protein F9K18_13620, partial [Thermoanaerobaculia bacterium]
MRPAAPFLALALLAAPARAAESPATPLVTRVTVRSETPVSLERVERLLAVRAGEPMDEERVRRTLRALRLAGLGAEVELWSRPLDAGVEAIVVLRPDLRVVEVSVLPAPGVD